jgi:hypothetical protein
LERADLEKVLDINFLGSLLLDRARGDCRL